MEIRLINKAGEIIDTRGLKITTSWNWMIGIDSQRKIMQIEEYANEEEAKLALKDIGNRIESGIEHGVENLVIRM